MVRAVHLAYLAPPMAAPVRVVFVVPYALDTSLRFARAVAALSDARTAVVTQEAPERLPADFRARLAGVERVADALDAAQLEGAVQRLAGALGGPAQRLIGVLEQLQVPLAQVRERLKIRSMDPREAQNFRDKAQMKDTLRAAGVPCARHQLASTADAARAFARSSGYPLVVKPPAGAGSRGTFRVADDAELESYLASIPPSAAEPVLLEEFMTGREHSFDSVTLHGEHRLHSISVYTPTPLEVMRTPWIQWKVVLPRRIDGPEFADIRRVGPQALKALGMVTGITHMEWFRRPDGSVAVSEVAARPPGAQFTSLLSYAHDTDFYAVWGRLLVHETFEVPQRRYAAGAVYLRGQGKGRVVAVRGAKELQAELGDVLVELKLPQPGTAPTNTYEGDGFAIARHADTAVVEKALSRALQLLRIELG
jgi:biotin carboxylase